MSTAPDPFERMRQLWLAGWRGQIVVDLGGSPDQILVTVTRRARGPQAADDELATLLSASDGARS